MTALTLHGDRRMTVKEVAEALNISERTIQEHAKAMFPGCVRNGMTTMLDEHQVTSIKKAVEKSGRNDLANVREVSSATTALEIEEMTLKVIAYHKSEADRLRSELSVAAPKAAIADRIAVADGRRTISDVGKINGVGPRKLFSLLEERGIIYRGSDGRWRPYQSWVDAGYFELKESTYETPDGSHLAVQTYVTGAGELWLARRLFTEVS